MQVILKLSTQNTKKQNNLIDLLPIINDYCTKINWKSQSIEKWGYEITLTWISTSYHKELRNVPKEKKYPKISLTLTS